MKKIMAIAIVAVTTLFMGCATMPVTTGGTISEANGEKVSAEVSNFNILGAFTPMGIDKVEQATSELSNKCPSKKVVNVTSSMKSMFLFVVSMETLTVSGICE